MLSENLKSISFITKYPKKGYTEYQTTLNSVYICLEQQA